MFLQLLGRNLEALDDIGRGDDRVLLVAARGEQEGQERLQQPEPLRRHRPGRALGDRLRLPDRNLAGRPRWRTFVTRPYAAQAVGDLAPEIGRRDRHGTTVLAQNPRGEHRQARVRGDEDPVLEAPAAAERALDPPGRFGTNLDSGFTGLVAELPGGAPAKGVDVELRRDAEVALPAGREPDVATDSRDSERSGRATVEVVADDVPDAAIVEQTVWIEGALACLSARHRTVRELDGALLRDRGLDLRQPPGHLRRVVGVAHLHADSRARRCLVGRRGSTEREVLERQPERLCIGELAFEQVEAGLKGGQLVVGQIERGQEVALGAQGVELLARELVALRLERDAEVAKLGPV